jgi:alcohol dehydrogenase (cytochrome c)
VDVATGNTVWQYQHRAYNYSAVLATAGGLVFKGDAARYFFSLDADRGKKIWQVRLGSMCCGYPVSYSVDGRQYIASWPATGETAWRLKSTTCGTSASRAGQIMKPSSRTPSSSTASPTEI